MPNYNQSPRESFCRHNDQVSAHHTVVENPFLRKSIEVALAEYARRQTKLSAADLGGCAACHLRLQGAHELVELFYNLCETTQASPRLDSVNLPSNVKPKKD